MKKTDHGLVRGVICMCLVFIALLCGALAILDYMNAASGDAQLEIIENAVRDAAITCYAVEGMYPMELKYLVNNYGLHYDDGNFVVFYDAFASNVMPEIRVRPKGGLAHE